MGGRLSTQAAGRLAYASRSGDTHWLRDAILDCPIETRFCTTICDRRIVDNGRLLAEPAAQHATTPATAKSNKSLAAAAGKRPRGPRPAATKKGRKQVATPKT